MLFISDVQYYVPVKLCRMAESIHQSKITGPLGPGNVKLKWNFIWDVIELDWKGVNITLNENKINLPSTVTIKIQDKFKIRHVIRREPLLFHIMLKQGFTWFTSAHNNTPEASNPSATFYMGSSNINYWKIPLMLKLLWECWREYIPSGKTATHNHQCGVHGVPVWSHSHCYAKRWQII